MAAAATRIERKSATKKAQQRANNSDATTTAHKMKKDRVGRRALDPKNL